MEIYLVGGAVRDGLLGRPVQEKDWVVVGGSAQALLDAGFRQVGKDFPVFLHPESREEYALARTERKTGPGHKGFEVSVGAGVSLEEDLSRRDLTVNAMAEDDAGCIIDPFDGRHDIERRVLRHVSDAFNEDPLRVFRVARFAAQLSGFSVADETVERMRHMADAGDLAELSAERIWGELEKALRSENPARFFEVLDEARALIPWFAEIQGVELPTLIGLSEVDQRYALLVSTLGLEQANSLGERLKVPQAMRRLGSWIIQWGAAVAGWRTTPADEVYRALHAAKAFKPNHDLARRLDVVRQLDPSGGGDIPTVSADLDRLLEEVEAIASVVTAARYQARGLAGAELGAALDAGRVDALTAAQAN